MKRNRILKESPEQWQDFSGQIVNNVYDILLNSGYEKGEIDSLVSTDAVELDMIDDQFVLYCGNDIIYTAPKNTLIHKYFQSAEEALMNWCIDKIGREIEPIDSSIFFENLPESKKSMKLTEAQFKTLIEESVKRVLTEISWGTAEDAVKKSDNRVDMLKSALYDFSDASEQMIQALNGQATETYYDDDVQPQNTQGPILARKIEALENEVMDYVKRKSKQLSSLSQHSQDKFNAAFDGRSYDEVADYIGDKWEKHFDEENYTPWDRYREQHLTPDEIEFNRRNP